ncbi:hypothetical protein N7G274_007952 [Stereocaulon virgatum]|uniref:Uncharacterized protein n=1 Tax=Stereocaulon virgatum TaxID=373712 RepID=A0ABR4A019_9LECA
MATAQQPKRPAPQKQPGNNILSRMLQMEKQSKQQRAASASPTLPLSPSADYFSGSPTRASPSPTSAQRSPRTTPQSPLRPPMPRSQTSPALAQESRSTEKSLERPRQSFEPLRVSTTKLVQEPATEEICLSPSWSDHGEKERRREKRKAEKEQKERDKKAKHEKEKQRSAESKTGRRLSKKPPPAAMETQKMPSALRRNSWMSIISSNSTSGDEAQRSSREEVTQSIVSLGSFRSSRRSQSMPPNDVENTPKSSLEQWRPIVSPSAPKLPSFRWSSRKTTSRSGKSDAWGSDDAYEKDLIAFAYRLEGSSIVTEPEKTDQSKSKQGSGTGTPQQQPSTPTISQSSTGPSLSVAKQSRPSQSPQRLSGMKDGNPDAESVSKPRETGGEQQNTASAAKAKPRGTANHKRSPSQVPSPPQSAVLPQARSSHDGSSYVHKQRMYQQQRSIAGYEEQQAVEAATDHASELAAEYEALLSGQVTPASERGRTPTLNRLDALGIIQAPGDSRLQVRGGSVSPAPSKQRHRSNSPRTESASTKQSSRGPSALSQSSCQTDDAEKDKEAAQVRASMQAVSDVPVSKPQGLTGFKRDKILGFRRRAKEPPAFISVPYNAENRVVAIQSAPLNASPSTEPSPKRSKIERIFGEPNPSFAETSERKRSSSLARNQNREEVAQSNSTQSHSRTRTSSSTVLNDKTSLSRQLPKSKTEPILTSNTNTTKQVSFDKDAQKSLSKESKAEAKTATKVDGLGGKHDNDTRNPKPIGESNSKSSVKPALATEKAPQAATTPVLEAKPAKKAPAEVIVASETGDGLLRKASLTRPRSNPQLQTQTTATNSLPNLDFLPQLKHQPLIKRERQSPTWPAQDGSTSVSIAQYTTPVAPLAYNSPAPVIAPDLKLIPRSPLRAPSQFPLPTANRHTRSATDVGTLSNFGKGPLAEGLNAKPVAKLFVVCCKCKFWHDLPSKLYEAMALPKELHKAGEGKLTGARLETAVRCPWCEHAMTTFCCQGWTTVVYLHERHH